MEINEQLKIIKNKAFGVALLSLGTVNSYPFENHFQMYSIIMDSKKNEITFYNRVIPNISAKPTDSSKVRKVLNLLFGDYFFPLQKIKRKNF